MTPFRLRPALDDPATIGILGTILSGAGVVLVWLWRRVIAPWLVGTTRDALAKEALLVTPDDRMDARAQHDALLRLQGTADEHDKALDRLAPLSESVRAVQRQCDQQTEMLSTHTEILRATAASMARVEQSVTYLHDRVEQGTRTFRDRSGE